MQTEIGRVVKVREGKIRFLEIQDGKSTLVRQIVCDQSTKFFYRTEETTMDYDASIFGRGCFIRIDGKLVDRPEKRVGKGQMKEEILAIKVVGYGSIDAASDPIVSGVSLDRLRVVPHLRQRDPRLTAVFRVRDEIEFAIHSFMRSGWKRRVYIARTPILTAADCEGAGETFLIKDSKDFFRTPTDVALTVSGQLDGEASALALGDIYTFGPTFRAEHSDTSRHLAEFWMVEPELTFIDFEELQQFTISFIQYIIKWVLRECKDDIQYLQTHGEDKDLIKKLTKCSETPAKIITYREALDTLVEHLGYPPEEIKFGIDLESEMEKALVHYYGGGMLMVTHYPEELKSFYMSPSDSSRDPMVEGCVEAMDLLASGIGEIVGGSMREHDYDRLKAKMERLKIDIPTYLDLRKYSSVPHGGFGLGLERIVSYITGMHSVRDVIQMPHTYKHLS